MHPPAECLFVDGERCTGRDISIKKVSINNIENYHEMPDIPSSHAGPTRTFRTQGMTYKRQGEGTEVRGVDASCYHALRSSD